MKLDMTDMLYALSFVLDRVEAALLGVDTGHGKRVAYLSILMGKEAGLQEAELRDFVGCCLLHDNALTEFIHDELARDPACGQLSDIMERENHDPEHDHSVIGERNVRLLPFRTDVRNIVLYHHENADGTGTFGLTAAQTPLKPQILHLTDSADAALRIHLEGMTAAEYETLCAWVRERTGTMFSEEVASLFFKAVTYEKLAALRGKDLLFCLHQELHKDIQEYSPEEVRNIARLFARIVDYKSEFTERHSTGVAEKAERMARYYGFDDEKALRFYFAGAMHDIGKLMIGNELLEKPGRLTAAEYEEVKNHAEATYYILSQIREIPDIVEWASNHHEKLNGQGYPRGLSAEELTFEDQLMACIDIYQALTERRPYKDGLSHKTTMSIMEDMADRGELNADIIRDIDAVMAAG